MARKHQDEGCRKVLSFRGALYPRNLPLNQEWTGFGSKFDLVNPGRAPGNVHLWSRETFIRDSVACSFKTHLLSCSCTAPCLTLQSSAKPLLADRCQIRVSRSGCKPRRCRRMEWAGPMPSGPSNSATHVLLMRAALRSQRVGARHLDSSEGPETPIRVTKCDICPRRGRDV